MQGLKLCSRSCLLPSPYYLPPLLGGFCTRRYLLFGLRISGANLKRGDANGTLVLYINVHRTLPHLLGVIGDDEDAMVILQLVHFVNKNGREQVSRDEPEKEQII